MHCSNFVIARHWWSITCGAIEHYQKYHVRQQSSIKFHFFVIFQVFFCHWYSVTLRFEIWGGLYCLDTVDILLITDDTYLLNSWTLVLTSDAFWIIPVNIWQLLRSSLFSVSVEAMESIFVTVIVSMLCLDLCLMHLLASKGLSPLSSTILSPFISCEMDLYLFFFMTGSVSKHCRQIVQWQLIIAFHSFDDLCAAYSWTVI